MKWLKRRRMVGLVGRTWATGTLAGIDGITRPLVEEAEGVFLGMMAGAWSLFSNS